MVERHTYNPCRRNVGKTKLDHTNICVKALPPRAELSGRQQEIWEEKMEAEKWLNYFARYIALLERVGNGLGTLAFIWGTVVVLGGFSEFLGMDFWITTVIVFLEAFREFSRQSRSDDRFLFKTTGGFKLNRVERGTRSGPLYYVNALILTVCVWMVPTIYIINYRLEYPWDKDSIASAFTIIVLLAIVHMLGFYTLVGYISRKESNIVLQFSPAAALLVAGFGVHYLENFCCFSKMDYSLIPLWFAIYILARFGSPGNVCPFHRGVKVAALIFRAILLVVVMWGLTDWLEPIGLLVLLVPSVGNLQTPMALLRILVPSAALHRQIEVHNTENKNIKSAVEILYIMVLSQGVLYMAACIIEPYSALFRRSLAVSCGLVDKSGMESIDLYYEQAYDTFLQESLVGSTKKMSLVNFAVDSLNRDASRDKKLAAVRILDYFLQRRDKTCCKCNTEFISPITTSTKAVTTLISMLGWTAREDADIRLFASKVTTHLAPYLRIVSIPGTIQMVSSLLDVHDQQEISAAQIANGYQGNETDVVDRQHTPSDIELGNVPPMQGSSTLATRNNSERCSLLERMHKFLLHIEEILSIPQEDLKNEGSLPALGMQILEGLANDLYNRAKICRAVDLFPKIIGSISCTPGTMRAQHENIITSSLKLVAKLVSVNQEIGITLQHELYDNPFLIGNLVEILELEGSSSYPDHSKLAMDIIAKLATDKKTRKKFGTIQVIIDKLVEEFIGEDELSRPLRVEAGEALAMLARESPDNCSAMLEKTNYEVIGALANKLKSGAHVHIAASILQSLCDHSKQLVQSHHDSHDHLLSTLTVVFGRINDAEGKQMEALIGLASQICSIMSERIGPVLDSFADEDAFVNKLVVQLKIRKKPSPDEPPHIRRLLVHLTVTIMEYCPRYALIFRQHRLVEVLSKMEQYMGLMCSEEAETLAAMVARAKELIGTNIL
ncbi:hypothetical protein D1007_10035 [Hordeum vulgare]|nr:hypothetical protein D1007_10035 [Hordeum vulgare]